MPLVLAEMGTVPDAPKLLRTWVGYDARVQGRDLVVDDDDRALLDGPPDVLVTRSAPWQAADSNYSAVAREFIEHYLSAEFDEGLKRPPAPIAVDSQYGIKSDLEHAKLRFFFTPRPHLDKLLQSEIFPLFCRRLELDRVYPVTLRAVQYQQRLSLIKIPLLVRELGIERSRAAILEDKALDSVMPNAAEAISYVDALLAFGNQSFVLPLHRMGTALYFRGGGFCGFSNLGVTNNFEQLLMRPGALVHDAGESVVYLQRALGNRGYESMPPMAVSAVNSVLKFLNDPREHASAGKWDPKGQVQAHANVRLVMADLLSINFTASDYVRQKLSFSILDRIANIWRARLGSSDDEAQLFQELLSSTTAKFVEGVVRKAFEHVSRTASRALATSVRKAHSEIHTQLSEQLGKSVSEKGRLEALRILRNASHGTFLSRGQFEKAFMKKPVAVPTSVPVYVWFVVWALCLRPAEFLGRRP